MLIAVAFLIGLLLNPAVGGYKTLNATKFLIARPEGGNWEAYEYNWNGSPCHLIPFTGVWCK